MNARSITLARLLGCTLLACLMLSCSAPGYSPSLGLGVNQLTHRDSRLAVSFEKTPNALSAREEGPLTSNSLSFRYERALSDNFTFRTKLFFAQSVVDDNNQHYGVGVGLSLGFIISYPLGLKSDFLIAPRFQTASPGLFGDSGNGGGLAILVRHRLRPNLAIYGGPAAYFGKTAGGSISLDGGGFVTPRGRALGGHLGVSVDITPTNNFNLEVSPLRQQDNFYNRAVWIPTLQLAYAHRFHGFSRLERRTRREIQRMKRAK